MEKLERRPYSRPAFERSLTLETEIAQRFIEREYPKVEYALYHFEVVLRILGETERADTLESLAIELIKAVDALLGSELARLSKLREDHGVIDRPIYAHPGIHRVLVASPLGHQFISLIQVLDELMISLDALWLLGVLTNQQHANGIFQWQRNMLRLSRRIRGLPSRGIRKPATELTGESESIPTKEQIEEPVVEV